MYLQNQTEDVVEGVNALIKELEEELAAEGLAPGEVEVRFCFRACGVGRYVCIRHGDGMSKEPMRDPTNQPTNDTHPHPPKTTNRRGPRSRTR